MHFSVTNFASSYFENLGQGRFSCQALPLEVQQSAINSILVNDFDHDGDPDLVLMGNFYPVEVETPRNDAGYGHFLLNDGNGQFTAVPPYESNLYAMGDIRHALPVGLSDGSSAMVIARNNDALQFVQSKNEKNDDL